jgi:hypothetical protein
MTDVTKYDRKAIKIPLVKKTWKKVLKNERTLSRNWPRDTEVLVGVG